MMGNTVLLECRVPMFVSYVVFVSSWLVEELGFPNIELDSLNTLAYGSSCLTSLQACPVKKLNSIIGLTLPILFWKCP
jgi:hypothetical protein